MSDEKFVADGSERVREAYKAKIVEEVGAKYYGIFFQKLPFYLQIYYEIKMWYEIQQRLWKCSSSHNSYLRPS